MGIPFWSSQLILKKEYKAAAAKSTNFSKKRGVETPIADRRTVARVIVVKTRPHQGRVFFFYNE